MKPLLVAFLAFACILNSASARLLETLEECEARYGLPTKTSDDGERKAYDYVKNGYKVAILFIKTAKSLSHVAHMVFYSRTDGGQLSGTEVEVILDANGGKAAWSPPIKMPGDHFWSRSPATTWKRSDSAAAFFPRSQINLIMNTEEFAYIFGRDQNKLHGF